MPTGSAGRASGCREPQRRRAAAGRREEHRGRGDSGTDKGFDWRGGGMQFGADAERAPGIVVGVSAGFSRTVVLHERAGTDGDVSSYLLGLYGRRTLGTDRPEPPGRGRAGSTSWPALGSPRRISAGPSCPPPSREAAPPMSTGSTSGPPPSCPGPASSRTAIPRTAPPGRSWPSPARPRTP
ncbi:autotransporter outer membrane beta-barrel domain-containing protein [Skermanella sp. TT6]|uniref:Autotransporter outer membrane beta-barrel domain-containing protein n=1 Tax=Skermanella cutis TaxID=2775420 RepID=A0ABX7B8I3_9PROT|nr:autotransporter outer membrane beta-barrel domain-containing protein [Skermanella sp. TT6]